MPVLVNILALKKILLLSFIYYAISSILNHMCEAPYAEFLNVFQLKNS